MKERTFNEDTFPLQSFNQSNYKKTCFPFVSPITGYLYNAYIRTLITNYNLGNISLKMNPFSFVDSYGSVALLSTLHYYLKKDEKLRFKCYLHKFSRIICYQAAQIKYKKEIYSFVQFIFQQKENSFSNNSRYTRLQDYKTL